MENANLNIWNCRRMVMDENKSFFDWFIGFFLLFRCRFHHIFTLKMVPFLFLTMQEYWSYHSLLWKLSYQYAPTP